MEVQRVILTETVQARGETVTRERHTVQVVEPEPFTLSGDTVMQRLDSLKAYAASKHLEQTELLALIEQVYER